MRRSRLIGLFLMVLLAIPLVMVQAQQQQQPSQQQQQQQQNNRGNWQQRMQQMRERMNEQLKQALGVDDATWNVLQPRIQKVQDLQRELRSGRQGMFFRAMRGGRGMRDGRGAPGPGAQANDTRRGREQTATPISQATEALRTTLQDQNATTDQIKTQLDALRKARTEVTAQLTKAQSDLRGLLTVKQEAQLTLMGILD